MSQVIICAAYSFVFSKLSCLDIIARIKNCVYKNLNLCYFMSTIIERLYKSFSFINSSVQIQLELEILRNSSTILGSSHWRCSIKNILQIITLQRQLLMKQKCKVAQISQDCTKMFPVIKY